MSLHCKELFYITGGLKKLGKLTLVIFCCIILKFLKETKVPRCKTFSLLKGNKDDKK